MMSNVVDVLVLVLKIVILLVTIPVETYALSSSKTSTSFWDDQTRVATRCRHDPPPREILKKIQEQPWRGGLEPVDGTVGIPLHDAKVVEGKVPSDLTGMLCRNGPGRIRIGSSQYGHWFDGDGFVTQLALDGRLQRATFQGRYVETDRFVLQKKVTAQYLSSLDYYDDYTDKRTIPFARSGVWTKAGTGGRFENLFKIPTNPANTNVIFLDPNNKDRQQTPKLYAIAEGGDPAQLDTETLKTIGSSKIQNKDRTKVSKSFFSAHYKVDPKTKEIFNHGMSLAFQTAVNVMRLSPSGELLQQSSIALPSLCFIHDNALSENYFVLILPPYTINRSSLLESLLGGEPFGKKFRWNNEGRKEHNHTMAMVFSKKTLECVAQIPLELLSTYHLIDAFEEHDSSTDTTLLSVRLLVHGPPPSERIQVEECFSDLYRSGPLPLCQIMQYTMDVQRATVTYSRQVAPDARPCELPDANQSWGYKKRFLYTNVREDRASFTNSIQKVNMETGKCSDVVSFGDGTYAGAPIFIPTEPAGEDEDDGYILTQVYRSYEHRSDIAILDAKTMKVVTLLQLDTHVPYQFHGAWYPTR